MKLNALGSAPPGGLAPVGDPWASTLNYPTGTRHLGSRMGPAPASKQLPCSQLSTGKSEEITKAKSKAIAAATSTKGALRGRRVLEAEGNVPAVTPERLHLLQGQK